MIIYSKNISDLLCMRILNCLFELSQFVNIDSISFVCCFFLTIVLLDVIVGMHTKIL